MSADVEEPELGWYASYQESSSYCIKVLDLNKVVSKWFQIMIYIQEGRHEGGRVTDTEGKVKKKKA